MKISKHSFVLITALGLVLAVACAVEMQPGHMDPSAPQPIKKKEHLAECDQDCPHKKAKQDCPNCSQSGKKANTTTVYSLPIGEAPTQGPDSALVTVVVVSDFQCPYCSKVEARLHHLKQLYGDNIRFAFKHNPLPFHKQALSAAIASEAAHQQDMFWAMNQKLFANQRDLSPENYQKWAGELGLDMEQFKQDMTSEKLRQKVLEDQRLVASLGAKGVPAFFINGRMLMGAQPVSRFKVLIDEEMARASQAVAAGTPAHEYYNSIVAEGATHP